MSWLEQKVSGSLLPQPRDGEVRRVDLFQAWHSFIHSEFQDPELLKKYLDKPDHCALVNDSVIDDLYSKWKRKTALENDIYLKSGTQMEGLTTIEKEISELKKQIKRKYTNNVSNGRLNVHISEDKPVFDFKKAFEAIGGNQRIRDLGLDAAVFNKKSVKKITKIELEEIKNG